jgi:hypothetical protein
MGALSDAVDQRDAKATLAALATAEGRAEAREPQSRWEGRTCAEQAVHVGADDGWLFVDEALPQLLDAVEPIRREKALLIALTSRASIAVLELFDFDEPLSERLSGGVTALHLAAMAGDDCALRTLLPHSDPNAVDDEGRTALMIAAGHGAGKLAVAELVGASNARLVSNSGESALMRAAQSGPVESIEALLPVSDPDAVDHEGRDALSRALSREDSMSSVSVAQAMMQSLHHGASVSETLQLLAMNNMAARASAALASKVKAAGDPKAAKAYFRIAVSHGNHKAADAFCDGIAAGELARAIRKADADAMRSAMPKACARLEALELAQAAEAGQKKAGATPREESEPQNDAKRRPRI